MANNETEELAHALSKFAQSLAELDRLLIKLIDTI